MITKAANGQRLDVRLVLYGTHDDIDEYAVVVRIMNYFFWSEPHYLIMVTDKSPCMRRRWPHSRAEVLARNAARYGVHVASTEEVMLEVQL